jgi:hypothetical protein
MQIRGEVETYKTEASALRVQLRASTDAHRRLEASAAALQAKVGAGSSRLAPDPRLLGLLLFCLHATLHSNRLSFFSHRSLP